MLWLLPCAVLAQAPGAIRVKAVTAPLHLDATLAATAWRSADSITDFRQHEPAAGAPATERTVVKVLRDDAALYIGIRAYDVQPHRIRAVQLRRDADLSTDDYVEVLIDAFHDRRGAFLFGTNPNGAMWDAQLSDVDNLNADWNGIWDVATSRDAEGWTATLRIPFRTLRFRPGAALRFGFNVLRFVRRKNEKDLWRSWGRTEGLLQLGNTGELTDLGDLSGARGAELYPYVLARAIAPEHDAAGGRTAGGFVGSKAGLDAKVAPTPTLTADVTAGTDFAQVEADQQVINLTRFPFFFPEKRQFFLESSGLFDFATPGRVQPFYSRRIGLDANGQPVPILAGGRLYGRVGLWRLGALDVETGGTREANDAVVRLQHDLFARSYLGLIATLRTGDAAAATSTAGFDADFPLVIRGQNIEPKVWIMGSRAPGVGGVPLAWRLSTDYPNDLFDNFVSLYRVDSGFTPALGFVRQAGIWETTGHADFMPRPHALGIRQFDFTPIPTWDILARAAGSPFSARDWQNAEFEWRLLGGDRENGDHFEVNYQRLMDAPADTFEVFPGVRIAPRRYWWSRYELQYMMSPGRPLSAAAFVNWGRFYGGRSADVELDGTWRAGGRFIVGTGLTRTAARLPGGGFTALLLTNRLEYDFNARASLLGFVQFTNEEQRIDFNIRFHWIPTIGDDVFVVWNSGYTTSALAPYRFPDARSLARPLNGAFIVKAVHRIAP